MHVAQKKIAAIDKRFRGTICICAFYSDRENFKNYCQNAFRLSAFFSWITRVEIVEMRKDHVQRLRFHNRLQLLFQRFGRWNSFEISIVWGCFGNYVNWCYFFEKIKHKKNISGALVFRNLIDRCKIVSEWYSILPSLKTGPQNFNNLRNLQMFQNFPTTEKSVLEICRYLSFAQVSSKLRPVNIYLRNEKWAFRDSWDILQTEMKIFSTALTTWSQHESLQTSALNPCISRYSGWSSAHWEKIFFHISHRRVSRKIWVGKDVIDTHVNRFRVYFPAN